jgi:ketosteroid isomerase-like protein
VAVSDEDVEHVRRAFEAFNATSDERKDEAGIRAHFGRWYDANVEIVNADDWPIPASYRGGADAYIRWYHENYGAYEDVRYAIDSLGAIGDRVVALVTISGRPRGEETELEVQIGLVYGMRGGRIARVELYLGHERPVQAARATLTPPSG